MKLHSKICDFRTILDILNFGSKTETARKQISGYVFEKLFENYLCDKCLYLLYAISIGLVNDLMNDI